MLAHLLTFMVAIQELAHTAHMLVMIVSGLAFVETGAFLLVVTAFRNEINVSLQNEPLNRSDDGTIFADTQ